MTGSYSGSAIKTLIAPCIIYLARSLFELTCVPQNKTMHVVLTAVAPENHDDADIGGRMENFRCILWFLVLNFKLSRRHFLFLETFGLI